MSVLTECLGGEHTFTHKDKTYRVKLIDQGVMVDYERQLFAKARDAAKELRSCMTAPEYAEHLKKLNDDYIAGEYSFQSDRGRGALKGTQGILTLCGLLFNLTQSEMLRLLMECKEEIVSLIQLIIHESFPINAPEALESANGNVG